MLQRRPELERAVANIWIADRLWIKTIYESTAKCVMADGIVEFPEVNTVASFRRIHSAIGRFLWAGMKSVSPELYPPLLIAIDDAIDEAIGDETGDLHPELRRRLVRTLNHIAWAGLGGDG